MKDFIKIALGDTLTNVTKIAPKTKKVPRSIDISDVMPLDIPTFMKDNNVPDDAEFDGVDNGYDGWQPYQLNLTWNIEVPTTDKDTLAFIKQRFQTKSFQTLYHILIKNGYKRCGFNSMLLKEFDDTTVYDMYMDGDFDRLVKYYSLSFTKDV